MAESYVEVTEGSGKKLWTETTVVGADTKHAEIVKLGEPYLASYTVVTGAVSVATLDSHLLQIMAGASLKVYVRQIRVYQFTVATTAALHYVDILRLTTAGTGGTTQNEQPLDSTDVASGAQAMTLPSSKGTEGAELDRQVSYILQTIPASPAITSSLLYDFNWESNRQKSLIIPADTSKGIVVKNRVAIAGASVVIVAEYVEANF